MVAGNQPNKVICKIKQITPAIGLPMVKNVSHGKNKAINNLMLDLSVSGDIGATIIAEMAGCHQIAPRVAIVRLGVNLRCVLMS